MASRPPAAARTTTSRPPEFSPARSRPSATTTESVDRVNRVASATPASHVAAI